MKDSRKVREIELKPVNSAMTHLISLDSVPFKNIAHVKKPAILWLLQSGRPHPAPFHPPIRDHIWVEPCHNCGMDMSPWTSGHVPVDMSPWGDTSVAVAIPNGGLPAFFRKPDFM